ncbi:MAG: diguanylate cyclase [Deltaproteobacteria bacterium]
MTPEAPARAPLILVAEDERITREGLAGLLRAAGFRVEAVNDGQDAIDRVGKGGVSLVLLDVNMPRLSGLETCRILKAMEPAGFLPVVLCTVHADMDSRIKGMQLGADDYVCKPFDERELLARVNAMLRIKAQWDAVHEARARLETLATHDELTGLKNYRYLNTRLVEEWKRAERFHEPLAALMFDLDHFKELNDTHGHAFGDAALRALAERLRHGVRDIDVVARYGGDEFLVLLPNTHLAGALTVAERLWRDVTTTIVESDDGDSQEMLRCSIGVAVYPSPGVRNKDTMLKAVDEALYAAKREGRNRIFVAAQQAYAYDPGTRQQTVGAPAQSVAGSSRGDATSGRERERK